MCMNDDGLPADQRRHPESGQQQQCPPEEQEQEHGAHQPQHRHLQHKSEEQKHSRKTSTTKQTESVEDGGGGDGGDGGGGGGEEKVSATASTQVTVDANATSVTTVTDNAEETSTKTTTSKFTKTTKVKTIKIVKKKNPNSLVANAIGQFNKKSEEEVSPPKKIVFKKSSESPKKVPGLPKKIIKTGENDSDTKTTDSPEAKDSSDSKKENGEKTPTSSRASAEKSSSESKEIPAKKEPSVKKESTEREASTPKTDAKDTTDKKEFSAKRDSTERKESPEKDSIEKKERVAKRESSERKETPEKKETGEKKESIAKRDSLERKETPEKKETVEKKESPVKRGSMERKASPAKRDSLEKKGTIEKNKSVEKRDTPESRESPLKKKSPLKKETPERKGSPARKTPPAKTEKEVTESKESSDVKAATTKEAEGKEDIATKEISKENAEATTIIDSPKETAPDSPKEEAQDKSESEDTKELAKTEASPEPEPSTRVKEPSSVIEITRASSSSSRSSKSPLSEYVEGAKAISAEASSGSVDKVLTSESDSCAEGASATPCSNDSKPRADSLLDSDSELSNVSVFVIVRDMSSLTARVNKETIVTPATSTCGELMQEVGRRFKYEPDSFSLILQCSNGDQVEIDKMEAERTLADARFQVEGTPRNNLILCDLGGHPPRRTDEDDLSLGASASPTASASEKKWFDRSSTYSNTPEYSYSAALIKHETGYVGLVNQAMTCYLNSLLQTLYMTPEFRNAIYQWEFKGSEEEAAKNIPCQIQRLFLLLQTTNKTAVETTNLTKSFGWDSSEAWQQHDIQELCRVMFDALEQCFKNTHQSDLINSLYEGKMKDYVKCLECGNEGAREDTYLDIPLPIRPFGSSSAYKSVEEALRAFVEPELLTGNNKYKCSKCDSLCDAHKGLKFTRFPYLLTIHLMRFDFDYQTLHRIKLNDKVTFPNILDLNSFIETHSKEDSSAVTPDKPTTDKLDDASTTDSGSALDVEDNSVENTSNSQPESDNQDEDEGIDVSSMNNEKNKNCLPNGPYVYELFSIMVHAGSASGGHYYAYIKDFRTDEWFCFNDQSVSKITYDDIRKTYGGGTNRVPCYSWSSSANAYMLMYRQINKERNVDAYSKEALPQHIKDLVQRMSEEEAAEREQREIERCMCCIKLFCQVPGQTQMQEKKLRVHKDSTLRETTKLAYEELGLNNTVPLERCRLVKYEEFHDSLECSFDGQDDELISEVLGGVRSSYKFDLLMEIRDEDKAFEVYKPGGTTIKAHIVNLATEEVEGPYNLRGSLNMTVRELKEMIGRSLNMNPDTMRIVLERYYNDLRPLTADTKTLKMEGFYRSNKVYVEASGKESIDFYTGSCMYSILDRYENTITLYCPLPDTSKEALEEMQIPPYKEEEPEPRPEVSSSGTSASATAEDAVSATSAASPASCSSKDSGISSKAATDCSSSEAGSSNNSSMVSPSSGPLSSLPTSAQPTSPGMSTSTQATTPTASPTATSAGNGSDGEDEGIADADSGAGSSNVNSDQSASEDSSLTSDSDRTLVGDPPEDKLSDTSNSPDYRNVSSPSSPEDNGRETKDDDNGWGLPIFQDTDVVWGDEDKETEVKRYFRAEYFTEDQTNQKMLRVFVDKRITIGQLKNEMQPWVGVSQDHFKLFKIYSNSQEFECTRMTETLASYGDNTRLSVRLGRALLPGEQRGKVYLLEPDSVDDPAKFLIDWVVCKGDTVASAKRAIIKEVNTRCNMTLTPETVRLRKKSWKNPQTIYLDAQKFEDDIPLYSNWELFLQIIEGPETKTASSDELALFTKRWKPSTYTTDAIAEVIISKPTVEGLREKLSEISGIEADDIEFAKGKGTFPFDMSVVDINSDLDWSIRSGPLDQRPLYILDDGAMVYYRDKKETPKEMTEEERRALVNSENRRLNRDLQYQCPSSSTTSSYSTLRSKEKGLKIYLNHEE